MLYEHCIATLIEASCLYSLHVITFFKKLMQYIYLSDFYWTIFHIFLILFYFFSFDLWFNVCAFNESCHFNGSHALIYLFECFQYTYFKDLSRLEWTLPEIRFVSWFPIADFLMYFTNFYFYSHLPLSHMLLVSQENICLFFPKLLHNLKTTTYSLVSGIELDSSLCLIQSILDTILLEEPVPVQHFKSYKKINQSMSCLMI